VQILTQKALQKYDAIHTQPQLGLKTLGVMYEIARQVLSLLALLVQKYEY
jgi:hypothetical protein